MIGPENSHHLLHQSDKKNLNQSLLGTMWAWNRVGMGPRGHGFYLSPHWLLLIITFSWLAVAIILASDTQSKKNYLGAWWAILLIVGRFHISSSSDFLFFFSFVLGTFATICEKVQSFLEVLWSCIAWRILINGGGSSGFRDWCYTEYSIWNNKFNFCR